MKTHVLILPGLYNSGPQHWQSIWEDAFPSVSRVQQDDWETPVCADWVGRLEREVACVGNNSVLVAHSLACTLVAKWAEKHPRTISGALLVAPSDTEAPTYPSGTEGFAPIPLQQLPFRSIVVVGSNDPYVTTTRAELFAHSWGSELAVVGDVGHIGSDSGLGIWTEGLAFLAQLTGDNRFTTMRRWLSGPRSDTPRAKERETRRDLRCMIE